jgi:hypothetical protein
MLGVLCGMIYWVDYVVAWSQCERFLGYACASFEMTKSGGNDLMAISGDWKS